MEFFLIYLFVMIEQFAAAFSVGWVIFWIGLLITVFVALTQLIRSNEYGEDRTFEELWKNDFFAKLAKRATKPMMIVGFIMGTIGHFMPTQKQLAIIVGSGVTYNVLTSEPAKQIGGKALQLLQKKIDKALKEEDTDVNQGQEEKENASEQPDWSSDQQPRSEAHAQGQQT